MVRALADDTGTRSKHDTRYAMLTALINQIDADERVVHAEIYQHVLAVSAEER